MEGTIGVLTNRVCGPLGFRVQPNDARYVHNRMPTKTLNAWTSYECPRCSMAISCSFGAACVIVEYKEHVEEFHNWVTY